MKKFNKPLYSIYPRIYCSGTILVNDVPVVDWYGEETREGGYGGDTLINHALLQSGKYMIAGKMFPRMGHQNLTEEDALSIDFYCADFDNWKQSRFVFHPKIETPWSGLSADIRYPYFEITTEIDVELPFILDGWQNSINLNDLKKDLLFNQVFNYYKYIHSILREHNVAKYLEISQEKMKLQEQAFYFNDERKKSFSKEATQLFSQSLKVEDLNPNNLKMEIIGNGKLVRLLKKDNTQPLQFASPDLEKQGNIELEIKLHMRSNKKGLSII